MTGAKFRVLVGDVGEVLAFGTDESAGGYGGGTVVTRNAQDSRID